MPALRDRQALLGALFGAGLAGPSAGCIPYPHNEQESPSLRGELVQEERPLAGILVRRAVNPDGAEPGCPAGSAETHTDAEGRFAFPRTTYFSAAIVFGDRSDQWRLCFTRPDGGVAAWESHGYWGGPPLQKLRCDMATSVAAPAGPAEAATGPAPPQRITCSVAVRFGDGWSSGVSGFRWAYRGPSGVARASGAASGGGGAATQAGVARPSPPTSVLVPQLRRRLVL